MSDRVSPSNPDQLAAWIRDVNRQLATLMGGRNRGPNSSWGLPFRMGDWEWFDNGEGAICARNVVTGVVQCPEQVESCCDCDAVSQRVDVQGYGSGEVLIDWQVIPGGDYVDSFVRGLVVQDVNGPIVGTGGLWQVNCTIGGIWDGVPPSTSPTPYQLAFSLVAGAFLGPMSQLGDVYSLTGEGGWGASGAWLLNLASGTQLSVNLNAVGMDLVTPLGGTISAHLVCPADRIAVEDDPPET